MTGTASAALDGRLDGTWTYATLPAANLVPPGTRVFTTDRGSLVSNGAVWQSGDFILVQAGIPLIIMPTCSSVGATGAAVVGTTLPLTAGAGFFYLPANFLATVSAAGWYYGTFTDGTHVQLYNNTFSGTGQPTFPAAPTAFAGLSGGTPTGSTGAQTALTVNVPANTMGLNGQVEISYLASYNSSGNNKTVSTKFGALSLTSATVTTTTSTGLQLAVRNSGVANVQVAGISTTGDAYATQTLSLARGSVDTTAAVAVTFVLNNATATDFIILESYSVQVFPN